MGARDAQTGTRLATLRLGSTGAFGALSLCALCVRGGAACAVEFCMALGLALLCIPELRRAPASLRGLEIYRSGLLAALALLVALPVPSRVWPWAQVALATCLVAHAPALVGGTFERRGGKHARSLAGVPRQGEARNVEVNLRSSAAARFQTSPREAAPIGSPAVALTPREAEVLELLRRGFTVQAIANRLYVSPWTVDSHKRHIFQKYGVHSMDELLLACEREEEDARR